MGSSEPTVRPERNVVESVADAVGEATKGHCSDITLTMNVVDVIHVVPAEVTAAGTLGAPVDEASTLVSGHRVEGEVVLVELDVSREGLEIGEVLTDPAGVSHGAFKPSLGEPLG